MSTCLKIIQSTAVETALNLVVTLMVCIDLAQRPFGDFGARSHCDLLRLFICKKLQLMSMIGCR